MPQTHTRLSVYSLSHFFVDLCCALLVYRVVGRAASPAEIYLIYNYCAFALQMPVGLIADHLNRNAVVASLGCLLVGLSFVFCAHPLPAIIIAGIGNALFHVGGGVDVLNDSGKKAAALGIYVSPGALGLFFGGNLGKGEGFPPAGGALIMLLCAALIAVMAHKTHVWKRAQNLPLSFAGTASFDVLLPALCLFLVVVLRSYAGMTMRFDWKSTGNWGLIATLAVMLGKCAGGFVMDRLGARLTSLLSLAAAAVLFTFSGNPFAGTAAIFLFNMTMPITLWALAQRMSGCKGFSFGLLTLALFLGFVPVGLGYAEASSNWMLTSMCILSALLMLPGVSSLRKGRARHAA